LAVRRRGPNGSALVAPTRRQAPPFRLTRGAQRMITADRTLHAGQQCHLDGSC
jgi:hypothetical protein